MSEFLMPSLGADMEAGTLIEWQVQPGDRVDKGQVIAVVETSKGAIDVEVFEGGVVEELYVDPDTKVPVGTPLARIGSGEQMVMERSEPESEPEPEPEPKPEPKPVPEPRPSTGKAPPGIRRTVGTPRMRASPAARRRARERGIDLAALTGSGPDGAIILKDVEDAPFREAERKPAAGEFDPDAMREAIAAAMTRSKREIPHYYLANTVDLHVAEAWLEDYNRDQPPESRLLMAALFMKAAARALERYPALNGHYTGTGFTPSEQINLGMAIHLRAGGLVAPAVLDAATLSLPELMLRLQDLVKRARSRGLRASEIGGATATVTALGGRGVDTVFGVIHPPQVAMIGVGRVRPRPLVVGDALAIRPAVDVSLAADHRVCDGHMGALFLNEIDSQLQQPEAL